MKLKKLLHNCPKVYFWMLLFKRGPKAPRRTPKLSAGARRRGTERPKLLVAIYSMSLISNILKYYTLIVCIFSTFTRYTVSSSLNFKHKVSLLVNILMFTQLFTTFCVLSRDLGSIVAFRNGLIWYYEVGLCD